MKSQPMEIFTRTYDFLTWLMPHTMHFPRQQRFIVTKRLQDAALDFQERIIEALRDGATAPWPSRASCDAGRANIKEARLLGVCLEPGHPAFLKRWTFEKAVWRATHVRLGTRNTTV